jgi:IS1 family transposase
MNKLTAEKKVAVVAALVEGCSIRSTARLTGVAKSTILRLLEEVGTACAEYQNFAIRNIKAQRVQVDEIWAFVGCKQKNLTVEIANERVAGDVWTWVALDSDSKLAISWFVGQRDAGCATEFIQDLSNRLATRVQLTSDGHKVYLNAVIDAFADDIDYAMLIKHFGNDPEAQKRYSPAQCNGCEKKTVLGTPDPLYISTSHVERQNLTMRMNMRRFTRLTNAFSKKVENHMHSVSLFYMHYNFVRVHQTLKTTPAIAAGISSKAWTLADIVALSESHSDSALAA